VVLLPVAFSAVLLQGLIDRRRSIVGEVKRHGTLFLGAAALVGLAAARAIAAHDVYSIAGRYGDVSTAGLPSIRSVLRLLVDHVAGLDLAVGVFPFVAALAAGYAFVRCGRPSRFVPFAVTSASLVAWLLVETAVNAAQFDSVDYYRVHERYLIYVVPLFVVTLLVVTRELAGRLGIAPYVGAAAVATALPLVIPYHSFINISNVADSFSFLALGRFTASGYNAVPNAAVVAVVGAAILSLLYVAVRRRPLSVVLLTMIAFLFLTTFVTDRVQAVSASVRGYAPAHRDWIDRAHPVGDVVLIVDGRLAFPWHATAFDNESVKRVYSFCRLRFGRDFGDQVVRIGKAGSIGTPTGPIRASYAVVSNRLGVRGRVVARNRPGHQVLVALPDERAAVRSRGRVHC
jgi:hypothetical protein